MIDWYCLQAAYGERFVAQIAINLSHENRRKTVLLFLIPQIKMNESRCQKLFGADEQPLLCIHVDCGSYRRKNYVNHSIATTVNFTGAHGLDETTQVKHSKWIIPISHIARVACRALLSMNTQTHFIAHLYFESAKVPFNAAALSSWDKYKHHC